MRQREPFRCGSCSLACLSCAERSRSQESAQAQIELKDDHPDAAEAVLRHTYGNDYVVPESAQPTPWRFHLNLHIAADKYLLPTLSGQARTHFKQCASIDTHVDNVHAMIRAINSEVYHDQDLTQLAEKLRRDNLGRLIRHSPYRADLERDRMAL